MIDAVFRHPSCLRHPMVQHNRLDSFPSQVHSLSLLQAAMSKLLHKGLPRKALPPQRLPLPRKRLSQSWATGEDSYNPIPFDRL